MKDPRVEFNLKHKPISSQTVKSIKKMNRIWVTRLFLPTLELQLIIFLISSLITHKSRSKLIATTPNLFDCQTMTSSALTWIAPHVDIKVVDLGRHSFEKETRIYEICEKNLFEAVPCAFWEDETSFLRVSSFLLLFVLVHVLTSPWF